MGFYSYIVCVVVPAEVAAGGEDAALEYAYTRMRKWSYADECVGVENLRPAGDLLVELEDNPDKRFEIVLTPDARTHMKNNWFKKDIPISDEAWWVGLRWLLLQYCDDFVVTGRYSGF